MLKVTRRTDLRLLLRRDPEAAVRVLDGLAAEGEHGCVLLERLRFGPPESWKAWQPYQGLMVVKLWSAGTQCERTNPAVRMSVPHPALVAVTGWGERWERRPWVDGTVLGAGWITSPQYAAIEAAVGALHARGQAHGDLTPANIIIPDKGDVPARLIDSGEVCHGTPGWCSAEPQTPQQRDRFALTLLQRRVAPEPRGHKTDIAGECGP